MNPVMVEVVQADRDAAADLLDGQGEFLQRVRAGIIRRGTDDKNSIVQAFARHRTRALTSDGGSGEVVAEIAAERARQVNEEGWTPEHDDTHSNGSMAKAAACYAVAPLPIGHMEAFNPDTYPPSGGYKSLWPWSRQWWKPKGRRRNLIRAAALIVAEIERLDRAALASPNNSEDHP